MNTDAQGQTTSPYVIPVNGEIFIKTIIKEGAKEIVNHGGYIWAPDRTGQWSDFEYRDEGENSIKLVLDKKSYRPGETAHVLALLPTDNAHLLVTTELATVLTTRQIDAPGRSVVIDVPIEQCFEPNFYLNIAFVKNDDMISGSQ